MSKKLDIPGSDLWVLSLFTEGYGREYYIREISALLPISHGTAQTILERLEKKLVLSSNLRGKTRIFRIKPGEMAIQYFILAEQYKKISFMEDKPYATEVLNKIHPFIEGISLLFGSYAKGTDTGDSDLDLLVAGHYNEKEVKQIGKKYNIEINIRIFPEEVFVGIDPQDALLIEAKNHHIVWKNAEAFVRAVIS
ncbi:MAG: nucleotidyltransferase domain-containing protein [Methanoregula sp.]|uniref:nucleotidyltransferase domain-containing protein n=1 Tax=Methanoregula sp. TaxID=2052170 RepID=UPI003FD87565